MADWASDQAKLLALNTLKSTATQSTQTNNITNTTGSTQTDNDTSTGATQTDEGYIGEEDYSLSYIDDSGVDASTQTDLTGNVKLTASSASRLVKSEIDDNQEAAKQVIIDLYNKFPSLVAKKNQLSEV